MKQIRIILVMTVTFLIISCKKNNTNYGKEEEIGRHAIDNLQGEEKQLGYNSMSSHEKYLYWSDRVNEYIKEHSFSVNQLFMLDQLSNSLNSLIFTNQDQQEIYKNNFLNNWINQAVSLIGDYHLTGIGDLLSDPALDVDSNNKYEPDEEDPRPCICNLNSDWTCRKRTVKLTIPPSYEIVWGICQNSQANIPCQSTSSGCGFLGLWSCNGNYCQF
jgi:hypothetical protein